MFSHKRNRSDSESSEGSNYNRYSMESFQKNGRNSGKTVYVSNISFECTYDELLEEFSIAGDVTNIEMLKNENNRFKGCALVTYKNPNMASDAIESLNRKDFKGRKLVVKEEDQNPEKKMNKRQRNEVYPKPLMSMNMSAPPSAPVSGGTNTYGLSMNFLQSHKIELPLVSVIFVANLGYDVCEADVKEIFRLSGSVVDVELFLDKDGKSRGYGIVEYEHPLEAVQAISMFHNQMYKDRPLSVRMDRTEKNRERRLPKGLQSIGMGLGPNGAPLKNVRSLETQSALSQIQPLAQLGNALMSNQSSNSMGGGSSGGGMGVGLMNAFSGGPFNQSSIANSLQL